MKEIPTCCTSTIFDKDSDRERFWKISRALGNPARLEIVRLLAKQKTCITGSIVHQLPLSQATVSQHLKSLKEAGVIHGTIQGTSIKYCLNKATMTWFRGMVNAAFSEAPETAPPGPSNTGSPGDPECKTQDEILPNEPATFQSLKGNPNHADTNYPH